jgi:hypothetical protein
MKGLRQKHTHAIELLALSEDAGNVKDVASLGFMEANKRQSPLVGIYYRLS